VLIFLDTETTGLEVSDRICALGVVYENNSSFELINPTKKIPPIASSIHHITNEMAKDAPAFEFSKSYPLLQELNTKENILVSHNAPFDVAMLQKEGVVWQGGIIDTLKCSKALMEDLGGYGLQFLRYECRLYRKEEERFEEHGIAPMAHNALSDALHTKMLLEYLEDLECIEKLVEISQSRLLIKRFPFGKYAKKSIKSVALKDPKYVQWMVDSMMELDEDLRYSIDYYIRQVQEE
jgi:DNA polymerase III epsilon subunit-like protein